MVIKTPENLAYCKGQKTPEEKENKMMCKECEIKKMAMDVMMDVLKNVDDTLEAVKEFAKAFGLYEEEDEEEELEKLVDAVSELEPGIPKRMVEKILRTAYSLLEADKEGRDVR